MRFQRSPWRKIDASAPLERSPQRVRAAVRREKIEKDKVALFPELQASVATAEEYMSTVEKGRVESSKEWRKKRADDWRKVRRELEKVPPISRAGIMRLWAIGYLPGDPLYLSDLINQYKRGVSPWHKLAEFRKLKLIAERRLDRKYLFGADTYKKTI